MEKTEQVDPNQEVRGNMFLHLPYTPFKKKIQYRVSMTAVQGAHCVGKQKMSEHCPRIVFLTDEHMHVCTLAVLY